LSGCCDRSGKSSTSARFESADILDVSKIVKRSWAFNGLMGAAALLLPVTAETESHIQTGAASAAVGATAHLNFRIIIPRVLYVRTAGAETLAILSNSHNVTLTATVRSSDTTANQLTSADVVRNHVILSAAARKVIAQDAACAPGGLHPPPALAGQVVCTASMP
jgi:hypothetical protein